MLEPNKIINLGPNAIFIAFDDKYFNFVKSCINSIKLNYVDHPKILLNYSGSSQNVVNYLNNIESVELISLENKINFDLGIIQNKIIYNRFYLWSEAFDDYNSILHLDADTLVLGSLESLFAEEDFFVVADNHPKAHIFLKDDDLFYKSAQIQDDHNLDHELKEDGVDIPSNCISMVNAGVFLIPRKYRSIDHFNQLIAIGNKYNDHITYADQSIISLWCFFNKIPVRDNYEFNFQIRFFYETDSLSDLADIRVIHFTGDSKNYTKGAVLTQKEKSILNIFHELRHHFRASNFESDYQKTILLRLDKLFKKTNYDDNVASAYFFSEKKQAKFGLKQIIQASYISDIEVLTSVHSGCVYVYIDKLQEVISQNLLLNNRMVYWVLVVDETLQIDIKKLKDLKVFFDAVSLFNVVICTSYDSKRFIREYSATPAVFVPASYTPPLQRRIKDFAIKTIIFVIDELSIIDERSFIGLPFKQKKLFISSLADEEVYKELEVSIDSGAAFIDFTKQSSPWVLWAANKGLLVFGFIRNDYLRYCYPYTALDKENPTELLKAVCHITSNQVEADFVCELASQRALRFSCANVAQEAREKMAMFNNTQGDFYSIVDDTFPSFSKKITKVSGPDLVNTANNEFVVFCVFKNASPYLSAWLHHYKKLGAKHFFLVDNMSADDSRSYFRDYTDITLFETDLEFRLFESEIRNYVVKKYCASMWCLSVDIDEFFDFPNPNVLRMADFLQYQNQNGFTAVTGYMQDMIAKDANLNDFIADNIYVDNSQTFIGNYSELSKVYIKYNEYSVNSKFCFGGVRSRCFGGDPSQILLLKHVLTFQDGELEPHVDPHFCDKAKISDVSCVVLHYKFVPWFNNVIEERANNPVFNIYSTEHYKKYFEYLKENNFYDSESAKLYDGLPSLIERGFVSTSPAFENFVASVRLPKLEIDSPLVSCLCITSGRASKLKTAIECFNAQSYNCKELVVICDVDDKPTLELLSVTSSPKIKVFPMKHMNKLPIGSLRNMAIDRANGEYVCTWDDDDWYNVDRLAIQYSVLKRHRKQACILSRIFIVDAVNNSAYLAYSRLWENSLFVSRRFLRDFNLSYPPTRIGEDYLLVDQLVAMNAVYPLEEPALYIYRISGQNTWPMEHFNHIVKKCTRLTERQHLLLKQVFEDGVSPAEISQKIYSQSFLFDVCYVEQTEDARP